MTSCSGDQLETMKALVADAGFTDSKLAYIRTVCQNFTFTTEQAAELIGLVDMSDDKIQAIDLFADALIDPSNADPIVALLDMDDDKEAAAAKLSGFSGKAARELRPRVIEDDGHRSEEAMERVLEAIDSVSMSDEKVAMIAEEVQNNPSPPYNAEQLIRILQKFEFSDDIMAVLDMFVGPQIVYPMTCEEIIAVLDVLSMSDDKIKVLPSLKPFIYDAQNKLLIVASFSFSSDKEKAEEILRDVVVDFKPKSPPPEKIQEALQAVGTCPAGYTWRKVQGGYRCAAGGHYVSDAQINEYLESN